MDLYEITHMPTNMKYIGITYKHGKTYKERFTEHLNHNGSMTISNMIHSGISPNDFTINLIEQTDSIDSLFFSEIYYINKNKKDNCSLNLNSGGGFIGKKYFLNSIYKNKQYDVNIFYDNYIPVGIQKRIDIDLNISNFSVNPVIRENIRTVLLMAVKILDMYDYINLQISYLDFYNIIKNDIDFIYTKLKSETKVAKIVFLKAFIKTKNTKLAHYELREYRKIVNNAFFEYFFLSKHANMIDYFRNEYNWKVNSAIDTENWTKGRKKFKERLATDGLTNNEKIQKSQISDKIQAHWATQNKEYIDTRTNNSLSVMNSKIHKCIHCGRDGLTLGNLKRHHNDNCKLKI